MGRQLEFINKFEADSVVYLSTGQVFTAQYDTYFVELELACQTSYNEIYLLDSSNARLNDSTDDPHYDSAMLVMKANTSFAQNIATNTYVGWREIGTYLDNKDEGYGMSFYVFNPFNSNRFTYVLSQNAGMVSNVLWGGKSVGAFKSNEQCNGLYFTNSGGATMDYIKANIYGIK